MTDETRPPPDGPGGRRKRPPTVLDLEATDVTPSSAAPSSEERTADAPPVPPETAAAGPSPDSVESSSDAPPAAAEQPEPEPRQPRNWLPEGVSWTHLGAGISGATGGLLVFLLLWAGGALPGVRDSSPDVGPQFAAIQQQLKELANRPTPATVDPKSLDAVTARLARLERANPEPPPAPVPDPAIANRIGATETAQQALTDRITALVQRADGLDGAVRDTNARIEKLSTALGETQAAMQRAQAGHDRASRFAVAALALREQFDRGEPFAAELALVKPLATDAAPMAALEPFAVSGVPGDAALGRELAALVRPMLQTPSEAPSGGGFLDRLQVNAEKLVRIRPIGEARGDDRGAILARIERRAEQGDIPGALAEIGKLPADARAPLQAWVDKAGSRIKALEASRRLAADAVAALKPAP